jgi:hypothetical protein
MLTDKLFNRKEVIDIIAMYDFQIILNNNKVDRIVEGFWNGPYENEWFMNSSFAFQQFSNLFNERRKFLNFNYEPGSKFSIGSIINKPLEDDIVVDDNFTDKGHKAHFFHYERWNDSMKTKYIMEAIFLVALWIVIFRVTTLALNANIATVDLYAQYGSLITQLSNSTLTDLEMSSLQSQLTSVTQDLEPIFKEFIYWINVDVVVNVIASVYLFRNLKQFLFIKLRNKDSSVLRFEWIMNAVYWYFLGRITFDLYFVHYPAIDDDEEYYYTALTNHIYAKSDENYNLQPTFAL